MVQYSVYSKIIMNSSVLKYQKKKLYENIPPKGHVLTLVVTEKQFNNIEVLSGEENRSNQEQSTKRMIEL